MTHSDDDGLVLPPRLAPIHAVIVPIYRNDEQRAEVLAAAERIKAALRDVDLAPTRARYRDFLEVVIDDRDMRPGAKFYEWERKGVPMRIELGPKDLEKGQVCFKLRLDTPNSTGKQFVDEREFLGTVRERLLDFQSFLLERARGRLQASMVEIDTWEEFEAAFAGDKSTFAWCHWDGTKETEAAIKEKTKVTIRCIPLEGQGPAPSEGKCIFSGKASHQRVLMAKAY